jgi:cytidylate kinase
VSQATIVAFAGRIGAGKSSVAKALADHLGWKLTSFGAYIRTVASSRGLSLSRESLQAVGEELEATDATALCRAVLNAAFWQPGEPLVIEGIRHLRVLEILKSLVAPQPLVFVYLEADEEQRRSRLRDRGTGEAERLDAVEAHPTEQEVFTHLPKLADLVLSSAGGSESELATTVSKPGPVSASFALRFSFAKASRFICSFICEYFLNTFEAFSGGS